MTGGCAGAGAGAPAGGAAVRPFKKPPAGVAVDGAAGAAGAGAGAGSAGVAAPGAGEEPDFFKNDALGLSSAICCHPNIAGPAPCWQCELKKRFAGSASLRQFYDMPPKSTVLLHSSFNRVVKSSVSTALMYASSGETTSFLTLSRSESFSVCMPSFLPIDICDGI